MDSIHTRYFTTGRSDIDYPENKNTHYFNVCPCGSEYIGYKRSSVCFKCHTAEKNKLSAMSVVDRIAYETEKLLLLTMGD